MAKKERKMKSDSDTVCGSVGAENLGLERPYGSAPSHTGKYCFYINKGEGMMIVNFASTYAAKKFLDLLLQDDTIAKIRGVTGGMDTIMSSTMIKVRCIYIDEVLAHKYTNKEEQWEMGEPSYSLALRFRGSTHEHREVESAGEDQPRVKREKVEKVARPSKEGLITIQQIAEELKMEPRECRSLLRGLNTIKPDAGWCWNKNEVDDIKKLLQNNKE